MSSSSSGMRAASSSRSCVERIETQTTSAIMNAMTSMSPTKMNHVTAAASRRHRAPAPAGRRSPHRVRTCPPAQQAPQRPPPRCTDGRAFEPAHAGLDAAVAVGRMAREPRIGRHDRRRNDRPRIEQVQAMPVVAVTPAHAMQVGTGALGSPQERPVVREFFGARIRTVAPDLGEQRPDLLRVAGTAGLAYVDVAPSSSSAEYGAMPAGPCLCGPSVTIGSSWTMPPIADTSRIPKISSPAWRSSR